MQIYLSRPDITEKEIEAVCAVLRSPNLSLGPKLPEFEEALEKAIRTQQRELDPRLKKLVAESFE